MTRASTLSLWAVSMLVPLLGGSLPRAAAQTFPPGAILTVAGTGVKGYSGDGGPATHAAVGNPHGLAIDAADNLFIGECYMPCVRRVSRDGMITTVAGTGVSGFAGDGGPATRARLREAFAVAVDAAGQLFISDLGNNRVRKVDPTGIITTVAGNGGVGFSGDGGPATHAQLNAPGGLTVDPIGNLFISDTLNARVRRVDLAGIITTVAGGGHPADGLGDGGLATQARLGPGRLAIDQAGNLYIVDVLSNRVRRMSPDGRITTVAGGGSPADGVGDGGRATDALLDVPFGLTVDPGGNLFITESHGERIRKVSPEGFITTVAGTGQVGYTPDGGPATAAQLNAPDSVVVDRAGNLIFTEANRFTMTAYPDGTFILTPSPGNNLVRAVIGVAVPQ